MLDGHHVLEWKPPLKPPVLVIEHPTSVSMGLVVSVVVVCPVGIKDSFVVVMTSNSLVGHLLEKKSKFLLEINHGFKNLVMSNQRSDICCFSDKLSALRSKIKDLVGLESG
jgi:hypothetical protein